jgi:calcineurin-like phosphoesterase family protein
MNTEQIHFTSDHHFQHENIIKFGRGHGQFKTINHHDKILCDNWYRTVAPSDKIILLGDIALGDAEKSLDYFRWLPGIKLLVPGNHDKIFSGNSKTHVERWWKKYEEVGFEILPETYHMDIPTKNGNVEVVLSHFPYGRTQHESIKDKHKKYRPEFEGKPLIHGHTHSENKTNAENPYEYHVGVDAHDFMPVPMSTIVDWLENTPELTSSKKKPNLAQKHSQS